MSRHLAGFAVLSDDLITIKKGLPHRLDWKKKRPSGITDSDALLAYKVWTNGKPTSYRIRIVDYDTAPDTYKVVVPEQKEPATVSNTSPVGLWEALPGSVAASSDAVIFEVTGGAGEIHFSDVVMWVLRN